MASCRTAGQLAEFYEGARRGAGLAGASSQMLRLMPKNTHPMDMLRTGVSMLAPFDPDLNDHSHAANVRKAMRLIARVSTLDHGRLANLAGPGADRGQTGPDARG